MTISSILIAAGMSIFAAACIVGLLSSRKMATILKAVDPALHAQLQLGAGAQLIFSHGSPESQSFILSKRYKEHPNMSVRVLGSKIYLAVFAAIGAAVLSLAGFVIRGVAG